MSAVTGSLSIKTDTTFYTVHFPTHGWMAADMVQNLDRVYAAEEPRIGILKLLGYTLEMNSQAPPRVVDHWVEIDMDTKTLSTNSELIRKAVKREQLADNEPYMELSLRNVYRTLDSLDFSVRLYS